MRLLRLSGRKNCERVKTKGALWKGKHLFARWLPGAPKHLSSEAQHCSIFVGVLASLKLDKSAVKRNRMRRRCREALRLTLKNAPKRCASAQLLLLPRSSSLSCDFRELLEDCERLLSSLA